MSVFKYLFGVEKMIEAVKSTIAQASIAKAPVEAGSSLKSLSANPDKIQEVSSSNSSTEAAPYVSPTVRVDVATKVAVLEFRESDTGEVLIQIPSEQQIRAYQTRKARQDAEFEAKLEQDSAPKARAPESNNASAPAAKVEVSETQIQNDVQAALNRSGSGASKPVVQPESSDS